MTDSQTTPPRSLAERISDADARGCADWLDQFHGTESVHELAALKASDRDSLIALLAPADAAEIIEQIPEAQAIETLEQLDAGAAARIIEELDSDDQVDLLREIAPREAQAIIRELDPTDAQHVLLLSSYDDDVAGGLMIAEYLAFPSDYSVQQVLDDLQNGAEEYSSYNIQYSYITDDQARLVGVVPLKRLILQRRTAHMSELMIPDPLTVPDSMALDELAATFREHPFIGLPVVDDAGVLVGVVEQSAIAHALTDEAEEAYRQSLGIVGGEELRSMPLLTRARRRLSWLSINIVLNIIAASIIALHQDTLEAVIALAVFLPIISDMSGCSGNQAVAVSMREITLGVTRPRDAARVLLKEVSVGVLNGLVLGILIGAVALAWKGNAVLGAVVGVALMLNTILAVAIGGCVPLVLKARRLDPALASGPILTTITDMCGFFLVLSFAALALEHLI